MIIGFPFAGTSFTGQENALAPHECARHARFDGFLGGTLTPFCLGRMRRKKAICGLDKVARGKSKSLCPRNVARRFRLPTIVKTVLKSFSKGSSKVILSQ